MTNKERFLGLCSKVKRAGMDKLLEWLETTDFYTAPASTKYHGAYEGGLIEHLLDVYDHFIKLKEIYPELLKDISDESIIICTLFHDLCKVNFYIWEQKWRKDKHDKWEIYDAIGVDEKLKYGGHGSKSVYILLKYIQLTDEEAIAINNHMSTWEDGKAREIGNVYDEHKFAWLLHVADEAATFAERR